MSKRAADSWADDIDELEYRIGEWHRSVFGENYPINHVRAIAQKAEEEARELAKDPLDAREAADIVICGLAALHRLEESASQLINEKLDILRKRGAAQLQRDKARGIVQAHEMSKP
jgi:hypothetical protein